MLPRKLRERQKSGPLQGRPGLGMRGLKVLAARQSPGMSVVVLLQPVEGMPGGMALKMPSELNLVPRRQRSGPNMQRDRQGPGTKGLRVAVGQPGGDGAENAIRSQAGAKEAKIIRAQHAARQTRPWGKRAQGGGRQTKSWDERPRGGGGRGPAATEEPAAPATPNASGLDKKKRRLVQIFQRTLLPAGLDASGASALEPTEAPVDSYIGVLNGEDRELFGGCTGNGPDQDVSCDKDLACTPVLTPAEGSNSGKRLERVGMCAIIPPHGAYSFNSEYNIEPPIAYFPLTGANVDNWPFPTFKGLPSGKVEFVEEYVFRSVLRCSQNPRRLLPDKPGLGIRGLRVPTGGPSPGMNIPRVSLPPMAYQPRSFNVSSAEWLRLLSEPESGRKSLFIINPHGLVALYSSSSMFVLFSSTRSLLERKIRRK
ncbi:hypothetical protein BSKO_00188 [Bryopsis sp. KO-2023]|nr:hypothetical protein BSKO_00188 [Bryopsis sp. KO-2023]